MRKDVYAQPIGDDFESGGRHGLFDIVVFVWSPVLASCRRWFMPGNSTWPTQSPGRNWAKAEPVIPRADKRTRKTILRTRDRKSTRLNSSHGYISYAVFCLKKKKKC